ncbi:MAG: NAD(P)/FAD-dependent oxidoreductase [Candidatus Promineifilaceae bacterium]
MSKSSNTQKYGHFNCLIIGAGLAGLTAAQTLNRCGMTAAIVEASAAVGGRMASLTEASIPGFSSKVSFVFDHGAQYFTVRDERFGQMVENWREIGVVRQWSEGFTASDGSAYMDGMARFRGAPDMAAIAAHLAEDLDVFLNTAVMKIERQDPCWLLMTDSDREFSAGAIILTPPVPISLSLLNASDIKIAEDDRRALNRIEYEPCIAAVLVLDQPSKIPPPGGMWMLGTPITWMADNHLKGISPGAGAVTIHAGAEFSEEYWHAEDQVILAELTQAAEPWLGSAPVFQQVIRWPYSKPFMTYPKPCLASESGLPLIFAGDAFAGPRVEGAFLSGLAAAQALL